MKKLLTTSGLVAGLAFASMAHAAPMLQAPTLSATVLFDNVSDNLVLIKDGKYKKGHRKYHKKWHSDNGRHEARGHDKYRYDDDRSRYGYGQNRYNRGDTVVRYVIVDRPQRYGLNQYNRYVEHNGYVYAVDPNTNGVLALIGLASRLLN